MAQLVPFNNTRKTLNPARATLEVLYQYYGWLHRDISSTSMIYFDGRGKLADVEYTKHRATMQETHDASLRTGTIHFMSTEVAALEYRHRPRTRRRHAGLAELMRARAENNTQDDFLDDLIATHPELADYRNIPPDIYVPPPPFRQNHLHDIESVWWVACWFFFSNGIRDEDDNDLQALQKQLVHASELFPGAVEGGLRQIIFNSASGICPYRPTLHKEFRITALALDHLREELLDRYKEVESPGNIERIGRLSAEPAEFHQLFKRFFFLGAILHAKTQVTPLRTLLGPRWEDVPKVKPSIPWPRLPWHHLMFFPTLTTSKDGCKKRGAQKSIAREGGKQDKLKPVAEPPSTNLNTTDDKKPPRRNPKRKARASGEAGQATGAGPQLGKRRKVVAQPPPTNTAAKADEGKPPEPRRNPKRKSNSSVLVKTGPAVEAGLRRSPRKRMKVARVTG